MASVAWFTADGTSCPPSACPMDRSDKNQMRFRSDRWACLLVSVQQRADAASPCTHACMDSDRIWTSPLDQKTLSLCLSVSNYRNTCIVTVAGQCNWSKTTTRPAATNDVANCIALHYACGASTMSIPMQLSTYGRRRPAVSDYSIPYSRLLPGQVQWRIYDVTALEVHGPQLLVLVLAWIRSSTTDRWRPAGAVLDY